MAWWDINFHVDQGATNNWNTFTGIGNKLNKGANKLVDTLNPFNAKDKTGVFKNLLLPGWGTAGGNVNDLWKTALAPGLENELSGQTSTAAPVVATTDTATDTTDTTEPEVVMDPNNPGSTESGNVLLRRRKIQNALKYGFASTVKRFSGKTPRPEKSSLPSIPWQGTKGGVSIA
jgi:hypothetical protein